MKFPLPAILIITILFFASIGNAAKQQTDVPHEINGFRLGTSIDKYDFIRYRNYLQEMVIEDIGGFRKGIIYYGTCKDPGKIVKIQLKYKNPSRQFYDELLERYEDKFGKPDEFIGDAFGVVLAWKWQFIDRNNETITLILQHNLKNIDENIGNQVKLAMPERMEEERLCFKEECDPDKLNCPVEMMIESWENLIPQ